MTRENTVNVTQAMLRAGASHIGGGSTFSSDDRMAIARAVFEAMLSAAPIHEGEGEPVAWRWSYYGHGRKLCWILSTKPNAPCEPNARQCGVIVEPLFAAPPPSVEVFGSSSLKGEDTHRVAETAVLVPRDQLETLRTSLQLGNLLPGEGESLISLWLMIADAEARK